MLCCVRFSGWRGSLLFHTGSRVWSSPTKHIGGFPEVMDQVVVQAADICFELPRPLNHRPQLLQDPIHLCAVLRVHNVFAYEPLPEP